jgi:primosomal protein N'
VEKISRVKMQLIMKLVTVIPLGKGIYKEQLTYFTTHELGMGALVMVPIQNRQVPSLVIKVETVADAKSQLRRADFAIKKISKVLAPVFFLPEFIEACQITANYYVAGVGQIISSLLPKAILEAAGSIKSTVTYESPSTDNLRLEDLVLQDTDRERMVQYKSLIREAFARNHSVFLCLPTVSEIGKALDSLEKGIAPYTVALHGKLTAKAMIANWQQALSSDHPILVIGTPAFLSLPRADIKTIIVDNENSGAYEHNLAKPHFDLRYFASVYAHKRRAKLLFGDIALRSETIHGTEEGRFIPLAPLKYRAASEARSILINLSRPNKEKPTKRFQALGEELQEYIKLMRENNERLLIVTGRRGLAPTTICKDCEAVVRCRRCQAPVVAHLNTNKAETEEEAGIFLCHHCGASQVIEDSCPVCGSWRLALLGIGREKITAELKNAFPDATVLELDSDTATTSKQATEIAEKFLNSGGSIMVGTEMALRYITSQIENVAFVGIDSLFTIPDYRINERIVAMLLRGKQIATKRLIIQTRNPEEPIYDYVLKGNLLDFYRDEIKEREIFAYPPFTLLIKITAPSSDSGRETLNELAAQFPDWAPVIYEPPTGGKASGINLLFKLEPERWPEEVLYNRLKSLPPSFTIEINPESIL